MTLFWVDAVWGAMASASEASVQAGSEFQILKSESHFDSAALGRMVSEYASENNIAVVNVGPGGFTAIKNGIVAAQAVRDAGCDLRFLGVSSLMALKIARPGSRSQMVSAGRGRGYLSSISRIELGNTDFEIEQSETSQIDWSELAYCVQDVEHEKERLQSEERREVLIHAIEAHSIAESVLNKVAEMKTIETIDPLLSDEIHPMYVRSPSIDPRSQGWRDRLLGLSQQRG